MKTPVNSLRLVMKNQSTKYERAAKRVKELKGFYDHIKVFLVINGMLFAFRFGWFDFILPDGFPLKPYYFNWLTTHLILWLAIIVIHGLLVFRNKISFFKQWEERQIKKFMEEDKQETKKYR